MSARKKTTIEKTEGGYLATVGKESKLLASRPLADAWSQVMTAPKFTHCRIQFNNEERRPFIVSHPVVTGDGRDMTERKKFTEFSAARRFAEERDVAVENHGRKFITDLSREETAAISGWRVESARLASDGVFVPSLAQIIREAQARLIARPDCRPFSQELVDEFVTRRQDRGIGERMASNYRDQLGRFLTDYQDRAVASITAPEIDAWLCGLKSLRKGGGRLSAQTRKHYRAVLHAFFGWLAPDANPVSKIDAPTVKEPQRDHYAPAAAWTLLDWLATNDPQTLPAVALGFFCGLRTAEIARLDLAAIDLTHPDTEGEFILRGDQAKRGKQRAVPVPPAAKHWLAAQTRKAGPVITVQLRSHHYRVAAAHTGAGVVVIPNGARHSFASYRGAVIKDSGRLADEMGNSSAIVRRHYREPKLQAEAEAFFGLRPGVRPETTVEFVKLEVAV